MTRERRAMGVRHVGTANWIENARKTMTHLPLALIHTVSWTGWGEEEGETALGEKQHHKRTRIFGENVKGACIGTANEHTLSARSDMVRSVDVERRETVC